MYNSNDLSTNSVQSENNQRIDSLLESYFSENYRERCYLGLMFRQGKRQMLQINVPAGDLPILLQAKPSKGNDPDSGKNRPEVRGHADEIKKYIIDRVTKEKPWILGTLTANVSPNDITITELGRGVCFVIVPRGIKLDITDGQHRKAAIHELIESDESKLIGDNDFPITLVLEEDFRQCQTDFKDMAQTRQLDKSLLLSFGEYEGQAGITKNLIEKVPMFQGKTAKVQGTNAATNKLIYTTNYIAKAVSCTFSERPDDKLQNYNVDRASEALINCLNQLFAECNQTQYIFNTQVEDLTFDKINNFKQECLLGISVGLEIMGRLLYCTYDQDNYSFDSEKVSQIAQLDWSRDSHLWKDSIVSVDLNSTNLAKKYKISAGGSAIRIAVSVAKAQLGWM